LGGLLLLTITFKSSMDTIQHFLHPGWLKAGLFALAIDLCFLGAEQGIFACKANRGMAFWLAIVMFLVCGAISVTLNTWDWVDKVQDDDFGQKVAGWLGFGISLLLNLVVAYIAYLFNDVILAPVLGASLEPNEPEVSSETESHGSVPEGMVLVPAPGFGKSKRKKKTRETVEDSGQQPEPAPAFSGSIFDTLAPSRA
jgi:hypothetical protein